MLVMYISGKAAFYDKRNKQIYIGISVLIFTLFAAVRYDVGVDYFSYLNEYNRLLNSSLKRSKRCSLTYKK